MSEKQIIKVKNNSIFNTWSSFTSASLRELANNLEAQGISEIGIDDYDSDYGIQGWEKRLETDKEFEKRIKQKERDRLKQEKADELTRKYQDKKDLKEWARLQKKFGKN